MVRYGELPIRSIRERTSRRLQGIARACDVRNEMDHLIATNGPCRRELACRSWFAIHTASLLADQNPDLYREPQCIAQGQVHQGGRIVKANLGLLILLSVAACSATDPVPSPRYDGYYAGVRQSDRTDACGIDKLHGKTTARVTGGHLSLPLFSSRTEMTGTVGDDGSVRASGIWTNPTGGFPGMTVLNGMIKDREMKATASDFRCHTDIDLQKVVPAQRVPHGHAGSRQPEG